LGDHEPRRQFGWNLIIAVDRPGFSRKRLRQGIPRAGLCGEMDNRPDVGMPFDEAGHRPEFGDADLVEVKSRPALQLRQPRLLQREVVIRVQIVDADDPLAAVEQVLRDVKADKVMQPMSNKDNTNQAFLSGNLRASEAQMSLNGGAQIMEPTSL